MLGLKFNHVTKRGTLSILDNEKDGVWQHFDIHVLLLYFIE